MFRQYETPPPSTAQTRSVNREEYRYQINVDDYLVTNTDEVFSELFSHNSTLNISTTYYFHHC
jgi:hypothetical protein